MEARPSPSGGPSNSQFQPHMYEPGCDGRGTRTVAPVPCLPPQRTKGSPHEGVTRSSTLQRSRTSNSSMRSFNI